MEYHVELTRFKVKEGKSAVVDEWMDFLNQHKEEVLLTLEAEKMYVETIFREVLDGTEYLYWYSIQGVGGIEVEDSDFEVDKQHLDYWKECIDPAFVPQDLSSQLVLLAPPILDKMKKNEWR